MLPTLARAPSSLRIAEIAGNDEIFLTGVAPAGWQYAGSIGTVEYALPLPTDPSRKRVALCFPLRHLLPALAALQAEGRLSVVHIYDY